MAELYLFSQDERTRANNIINQLENILQAAGYSLLDEKKLPPSEEEAITFFSNADVKEDVRTQLAEGFSFLSGKLESKYFYITYSFKDIEIPPTEEDKKTFSEEFLNNAKKYKRSVEWQYFTGESKRLAGIRVAEPITEESPAFNLLFWPAFKDMNVKEEDLAKIRKALNLEDHGFIYAPDYFLYGLTVSLLDLFLQTQTARDNQETEEPYISIGTSFYHERANLKVITELLNKPEEYINTQKDGYEITYNNKTYDIYSKITSSITDATYTDFDDFIHGEVLTFISECTSKGKQPIITENEFARRVANKQGKTKVSDGLLYEINKSLKKLNSIRPDMDLTEYMIALNKIKPGESRTLEGPIITFYTAKKEVGGHETKTYIFASALFFLLATDLNRLQSHKRELLTILKAETGKEYSVTKERISVLNYMLRRLEMVKGDVEQAKTKHKNYTMACKRKNETPAKTAADFRSNYGTILIDSMFNDTGVSALSKNSITEMRKYVLDILKTWKTQGEIEDFNIQYKGTTGKVLHSVTMYPDKEGVEKSGKRG